MIPKVVYGAINETWPMIFIFIVVVSFIRFFSLYSNGKKIVYYREFISFLFIIYLLLLFELVTNTDMTSIGNNFQPFKEITRYVIDSPLFYRNVLGNVLLFVPFGVFVCYYIRKCNFLKVLIITFLGSFTIEAVQLKIGRTFDVDDIILNVLGGIIGFLLYKILRKIKNTLPKFLRSDLILNIIAVILTILIIIAFINYTGIWKVF